mmetsp:Transcript_15880/g.40267  ORF Transcript_15880/g.40267 Transcript_15880/m.40267 type:complete len:238 (+) Transcript_15880:381-1094(+)
MHPSPSPSRPAQTGTSPAAAAPPPPLGTPRRRLSRTWGGGTTACRTLLQSGGTTTRPSSTTAATSSGPPSACWWTRAPPCPPWPMPLGPGSRRAGWCSSPGSSPTSRRVSTPPTPSRPPSGCASLTPLATNASRPRALKTSSSSIPRRSPRCGTGRRRGPSPWPRASTAYSRNRVCRSWALWRLSREGTAPTLSTASAPRPCAQPPSSPVPSATPPFTSSWPPPRHTPPTRGPQGRG